MNKIEVKWAGNYPNLCCGRWNIKINDKELEPKTKMTKELLINNFNTYKEYSKWYFTEDWNVKWEYYDNGLEYDKWVTSEKYKLLKCLFYENNIDFTKVDMKKLYEAINSEDWRHGSCGGCI